MPGRRKNGKGANGPKPKAGGANPKAKPAGSRRRANGRMRGRKPMVGAGAAYSTGVSSGQPRVTRTSVGECRIVHRELIASVSGSTAFAVASSFALNPGISATFPWLSVEAAGWERYKFNRLAFRYYTRTGTGVPGSVILSPDYDAADPAPMSEQQASSFKDAQEDAPWKDIVCPLSVKELLGGENDKYIRLGILGPNQDIKTYDSGNLHLCTIDGTAVSWGKLWVEYDVTFKVPQLQTDAVNASNTTVIQSGGTVSRAAPFGDAATQTGGLDVQASGATLTFNKVGEYGITMLIAGTVTTGTAPTLTGTVSGATNFNGDQLTNAAATQGNPGFIAVLVTAAGQTLIFDFTASATTITASETIVSPVAFPLIL